MQGDEWPCSFQQCQASILECPKKGQKLGSGNSVLRGAMGKAVRAHVRVKRTKFWGKKKTLISQMDIRVPRDRKKEPMELLKKSPSSESDHVALGVGNRWPGRDDSGRGQTGNGRHESADSLTKRREARHLELRLGAQLRLLATVSWLRHSRAQSMLAGQAAFLSLSRGKQRSPRTAGVEQFSFQCGGCTPPSDAF